jgi:hypothetical protein
MQDDDLYEYEDQPAEPVDENSLGFILEKALKSIEEVGGLTRAKLRDLVGEKTYTQLLSKPKVAGAIDAFMDASLKTKRSAGKLLAHHIARSTEHPELVDRISRELEDQFSDTYAPPVRAPARGKEQHVKVRSQQRSGQRVPDLQALARNEDIGAYRRARMNPRGNQRQHRHGV